MVHKSDMEDKKKEPKTTKGLGNYKFSYLHLILVVVAFIAVAVLLYTIFSSPSSNTSNSASSPYSAAAISAAKGGGGGAGGKVSSTWLSLSPSSGNLKSGSTVTVTVRENSGTTAVNAVQANINYPTDKFTFVSADYSASAFSVEAQNTSDNGLIKIARGATTPISGNQIVGVITFTLSGTGRAALSFASGTALVSSSTNQNLVTSLPAGASYRIQ